ncbi:MAG TPA: AEC family transporter [Marinobacterium sp.]|nr:AEC family transporter [Marinobacterium sp.]
MRVVNRLNMDIFLPALIFAVTVSKDFDISKFAILCLGAFVIVIGSGLIAWPVGRAIGVTAKAFVPPMMFNNCGNLGLPLALLAFGELGLAAAMAMFLVSNALHFTLGAYIVGRSASAKKALLNPMIVATVLGLLWSALELPFPEHLRLPLEMLGEIAITLMLVALGVRMVGVDLSQWRVGLYGAFVAPLSSLIIAIPFVLLFDLSEEFTAYLILFAALPPAVLNYLVAEQYQINPQAVASIVLIGNIASLVIIPTTLIFIL